MKAVRRIGDPRQADDPPLMGGRTFEVPIEGAYAESGRWQARFREAVQARLGERAAIRNADRFMNTLGVDRGRITFLATARDVPALPYLLEAIDHAIGQANESEDAQEGLDAQAAAKHAKQRETNDEAIEAALSKWSRENPPDGH